MKITRRQLKQILKEELQKVLNERNEMVDYHIKRGKDMRIAERRLRQLISEALEGPYYYYSTGALNELAKYFLEWMEESRKNPESPQTKTKRGNITDKIYEYYTNESSDVIYNAYKDGTKKLQMSGKKSDDLSIWYEKIKSSLASIAQNVGWIANTESPSWFQLERVGRVKDNTDSHKMYLTFNKLGPDGKISPSIYDNYMKLEKLLTDLAKAQKAGRFAGEVTFKIASIILVSLRQKDSVVIHFKESVDRDVIKSIVSGVGFDLVPRSAVGRTDFGVDAINQVTGKKGSDSQLAAEKAMQNIEMNKDLLERLLKDPATRDKGLSGLKHIMDTVMEKSSHRGS